MHALYITDRVHSHIIAYLVVDKTGKLITYNNILMPITAPSCDGSGALYKLW